MLVLFLISMALAATPTANPAACLTAKATLVEGATDNVLGDYVELRMDVHNGCGARVLGFAGIVTIRSTKADIGVRRGLRTAERVVQVDATMDLSWNLTSWGTDAETWLLVAPFSSMTVEWTPTLVVLEDGTVLTYRSPISGDVAPALSNVTGAKE